MCCLDLCVHNAVEFVSILMCIQVWCDSRGLSITLHVNTIQQVLLAIYVSLLSLSFANLAHSNNVAGSDVLFGSDFTQRHRLLVHNHVYSGLLRVLRYVHYIMSLKATVKYLANDIPLLSSSFANHAPPNNAIGADVLFGSVLTQRNRIRCHNNVYSGFGGVSGPVISL
jgi:hypothetical protein